MDDFQNHRGAQKVSCLLSAIPTAWGIQSWKASPSRLWCKFAHRRHSFSQRGGAPFHNPLGDGACFKNVDVVWQKRLHENHANFPIGDVQSVEFGNLFKILDSYIATLVQQGNDAHQTFRRSIERLPGCGYGTSQFRGGPYRICAAYWQDTLACRNRTNRNLCDLQNNFS